MREAGGLMYGPTIRRYFVILVDEILNSAEPADLRIEQPTKFELALNPKTAKLIGREIPPTLLTLAHRVIE
jgi:putative ABC transport system substrate-binding protein